MIIYFNGRLVSAAEAVLTPVDHGFLYGHGLFETMRAYHGRVFKFKEHINRLKAAADFLGWPKLPPYAELSDAITSVLNDNQLTNASVRLTCSRGQGTPRPDPGSCGQPAIAVFASPLPPPLPPAGWSVTTVAFRRNLSSPLVKIKSANYLDNILAKQEAKAKGAEEALMLNTDGFVAEGSMSNLFMASEGRLITPDIYSGILPGITRSTIIELAKAAGIIVEERQVRPEELADADEIFLTSSIMEVIPVKMLDGCPVGKSQTAGRGYFTVKLIQLYRELTAKE
ncbi:Branched-chain-amino-acid aminotransferase [Sporomusa acidovorans DSM 3132]|uniref:Branched-chain-amino-acid aminotransferase n=2 Tax=Sporomusa TaxID=2375 RepID=A0ABZ3J1B9_SPOA4|nr:aminotransferase class IV [Sporomusa acidovorans]OZC22456.1 branched-chain-amino-acid aminotransferase [Sporomusa acidovorans DSM 3132]SDE74442.1 branched chain amino acid aminotransferase apoenzyme [Sporomusa acidovorans]